MTKWLLIILIIFLCFPIAGAIFCEDILSPSEACNMTTPVLSCSTYNFSIYAEDGARIQNGSLIEINASIYRYEIINLSEGSYIQLLCDGRTRELYVREGDTMSYLIGIGILILGFIWLIMKLAEVVDKEHYLLKILLYIMAVILGLAGLGLSLVVSQQITSNSAINESIGNIYRAGLWSIRIIFAYIFVYYGYKVLQWLNASIRRRK